MAMVKLGHTELTGSNFGFFYREPLTSYSAGNLVYISSAGVAGLANSNAGAGAVHAAVGVILTVLDSFVIVQYSGEIRVLGKTPFVAGNEYWLGLDGAFSASEPVTPTYLSQSLGFAKTSRIFVLNIKDASVV